MMDFEQMCFYRHAVEVGMRPMSDRQRDVIIRRFGLDGQPPQTLRGIGEELHLCPERIRQIENEAIRKARTLFMRAAKSTSH